jgi:diguanylate cyclase (GGDEF)-like protein/putative nucleotidyltransferase with HDIG domain
MESYLTGTTAEPEASRRQSAPGAVVEAAPVLEARETSGMTSKLVLAYAEREGGREAVEAVLRRCGLQDDERDLGDEGSWFSYATKIRLFEALASVLDDPNALRKMGENVLDLSVGEGLKATLRALGTPGLVYRNVVRANARFSAVQAMELIEVGRDHARVRFSDLAGVGFHKLDCDYTAGILSCVPALFGQPPARVSHPVCGVDGADACIYDLSWSEHVSPQRTVIGSALAAALAVGGAAMLAPALLPTGVAVAGVAGSAAAWKVHRVNRRRCDQLEREAREHAELGQRLAGSLQDLTGELRLDELLDKITRNAQSAVGGKEYALLVEEDGVPRCRGSSELPAGTVESLERWVASAQTRLAEPLLVDDVSLVAELADIAVQESMPLRSVCAVPLTYGGRSLGALVALANQPRTFLPRDVDLLRSYGVQAAIALLNARLFEAQERLAARDPLTGLLNRRQLHEHLSREIERCRREDSSFGVMLLDLDGFKLVNDTGGHSEGDEVLRRVAGAMLRSSRGSDVVFRMGGDEFAVLLTGAPKLDEAVSTAERISAAIRSADVRVNASYGLATWPADGLDEDALLAAADTRLYAMKGVRSRRLLAARHAHGGATGRHRRLAVVSRLSAALAPLRDPVQIADAAVSELTLNFETLSARVTRLEPDGTMRPLTGGAGENGASPSAAAKASLPIRIGGRTWGILELVSGDADLDDDDLLLLDTVAAQLGAALQRVELLFRLERTFADTVAVLSDALEAKDVYTATHTREVAGLAERVGVRLGVEGEEVRALAHAALLHDIGKIAVRGDVLNKPGSLSEEEFEEIKQHTLTGVRMLERVEELSSVLPLIRSAHERWDGRGYPDGLAGERIPLGARVICACDAFHAMTSDRPYRAALSFDEAVAELAACAGTQFDPVVIDALLAELGRD